MKKKVDKIILEQGMIEDEVPRTWPEQLEKPPKWRFDYNGEAPIPRIMLLDISPETGQGKYTELWEIEEKDKYWRNHVEFKLTGEDFDAWHADAERAMRIVQEANIEDVEQIKEAYRGVCIAMTAASCLDIMDTSYQEVKEEVTDAAYSELF